jgi:hypothetical protein
MTSIIIQITFTMNTYQPINLKIKGRSMGGHVYTLTCNMEFNIFGNGNKNISNDIMGSHVTPPWNMRKGVSLLNLLANHGCDRLGHGLSNGGGAT